jgi:hypothetical protein
VSVVTVTTQRVVAVDGVVVRRLATVGTQGPPGAGVPSGGTVGQPLAKLSSGDQDTEWANQLTLDAVNVRTTPNATVTPVAGTVYWDDLDQALAYQVNGGILVDIGQENLVLVRNPPGGSAFSKGQAVAVLGAAANRLSVQLCNASAGVGVGCRTLGVVMEPIPSPGFGFVSTFGLLRGFNTNTIIGGGVEEGSELFISTTPGVLSTQPAAPPARRLTVGYVVTTGPNGSIFVTIRRGVKLEEVDNVQSSGWVANDLIRYDGSVFKPVRITADME